MSKEDRDGVTIRPARKDGTIPYQGTVKVPGAKAFSETFDTHAEAKAYVDDLRKNKEKADEARRKARRRQAEAESSKSTDERLRECRETTLKEAIRQYRDSGEPTDRTMQSLRKVLVNVDDARVGDLDKAWMRRHLDEMRKRSTKRSTQYAWATLEVHMGIMRKSVEWLYESRHLTPPRRLPFSNKLFPRNWDVRRNRRLQPGEEAAVLAKLRSLRGDAKIVWEALFVLAIETAARLQELVRAEWTEFDLETRNWLVPAGHTKTLMERPIPLRREALRALHMLKGVAKEGEPRLFHTFKTPDVASALWRRFISEQAGIKGLRMHDLRHEAATRMVIRPALPGKERPSVVEIMEVTGHSDVKSLRRYTNLRGDEMGRFLD